MSNDVVIKVENLSKEYRLGTISHGTLRQDLQSWWARLRGKEDPNSIIGMEQSAKRKESNAMPHAPGTMQGNDPFLFTFPDNEHSANENRFINIGLSANSRILVLPHTERKDKIRIISCRKATVQERRFYEKGSY